VKISVAVLVNIRVLGVVQDYRLTAFSNAKAVVPEAANESGIPQVGIGAGLF
jgi:hypothetical protein